MTRPRKTSPQTQKVLDMLANGPAYGYEIIKETGLASGSLYPILDRLRERGVLVDEWETGNPHGRPRRHLYMLVER